MFTGSGGSTALTGTVNGLGGNAAAAASGITPRVDSTFPDQRLPDRIDQLRGADDRGVLAAFPLRDFIIGGIIDPTDADDLLLPLVSDQEY